MKINYLLVAVLVFVTGVAMYQAYKTEHLIKEKDDKITELERQVWDLKTKQHTDSIVNYHVAEFRKKLGLPPQ